MELLVELLTTNAKPTIIQNILVDESIVKKTVKPTSEIRIIRFTKMLAKENGWRATNQTLKFKNAIIDPVKVIAPMATPIDISTKLETYIVPSSLTIP